VRTVDARTGLGAVTDLRGYARVRIFVFWGTHPFGFVDVSTDGADLDEARVRAAVTDALGAQLTEAAGAEAPPARAGGEPVSVVVASYDRPADLERCLRALRAQAVRRPVEIVVVDNHPASGLTGPVVAGFPGVVLVEEPRQGLAYARNAGFLAARGTILACTDDDVVVPPTWLDALVDPFADDRVMAVTGNILPLELETPAQWYYELYGGLGRGFARRTLDHEWFRSCRGPVPTWNLGATANAAFRASALRDPAVGLMDEALGPGMPSGVGEDTYLFYKILKAGHRLVYEPRAWVWHRHRRDMRGLRRQMYGYAKGHVAYLLTTWLRDGDARALSRLVRTLPRWHVNQLKRWIVGTLRAESPYPLSLMLVELGGHVVAPVSLWRSRRRVRREGRSQPCVLVPSPS
jgi:GT2 family glycosyltransferase